jgi:glucose/arabinose dehydrogenase
MHRLILSIAGVAAACATALSATTQAAGPPPPTAAGGQTVTTVASGLNTPTSFAFGDGKVFAGDGGSNAKNVPIGGVFLLSNGSSTKLAGSPAFVAGLAWHQGALYVSGGTPSGRTSATWTLQKWTGFNGTTFARRKVIYTAPKGFEGFNGIAFGPDGRLYVGVDVGLTDGNDHGPASMSPDVYDILSIKPNGKDLKIFAKGIRQPWQMAFPKGSAFPLVSALGQDSGATNPPDFVLKVKPGQNYGFPGCNHTVKTKCKAFAKPFRTFGPHTDIMGMAIIGKKLYMTSFMGPQGKGPGGEVFSMPLKGGKLKPVVTGFVAPTVGLGVRGSSLYIGELTGQVFSVKP